MVEIKKKEFLKSSTLHTEIKQKSLLKARTVRLDNRDILLKSR